MSYAIDTNVLARSVQEKHPMQIVAREAIDALVLQNETIYLLAQNLYEFWVLATRPLSNNGLGFDALTTRGLITRFETIFFVKPDVPEIFTEWKNLVTQHQVMGKPAHDARIAAAMITHDISRLLTFNAGDLKRFQQVIVVTPEEIVNAK